MSYQKPEALAATSATATTPSATTTKAAAAAGWLNLGVNLATKFLDSRQDTHQLVTNVREKFRTSLRDADFSTDLKSFGGNPLHWASGPNAQQVIRTAIEANLPVNECNKLGQTPLHIHCSQLAHLPIVITLLAHEADALQPDKEGNTPLHVACQHGHVEIVKLLVVFGASVSRRNIANATPWDVVRLSTADADKKRALWRALCIGDHADEVPLLSNSKEGLESELKTARLHLESELKRLESWRPFNDKSLVFDCVNADKNAKDVSGDKLLALDGGGMRGLILIILLMELEMLAGRAVQEIFDWIAGTSTGGILALALCTGKSLYHCLCLYLRLKNVVFSDAKPHVLRNLEKLLQEEFGTDLRMSSLPKKPRIMVATAIANRNPPTLHLFRNYTNPNVDPERDTSCIAVAEDGSQHMCVGVDSHEELVWKAARNTALAPTYFIQLDSDENFMDGGVMANNPTMAACTEISKFYCADTDSSVKPCPLKLIVSLGTGKQPARHMSSSAVNAVPSPGGLQSKSTKTGAVVPAASNSGVVSTLAANATSSIMSDFTTFATGYVRATHVAVAQLTDSEGLPVEYCRTLCKFGRISFFRFSPQLERFVELDCTDNATLVDIMWSAKAYVRLGRKAGELHELAGFLRRHAK